jgi:hypothetical protein
MGMRENTVWKKCLLALGRLRPRARLFRNSVGTAWQGEGFTMKRGQVYTAEGGERLIFNGRRLEFGLMKGSGDGIGWDSIEITPEMVGRRIAVFLSVETKAGRKKPTEDQLNWQARVRAAGGIALIINDPDQLDFELL